MEYYGNIEKETIDNANYRRVVYTSPSNKMQLVYMSLKPNEEIGMEVHSSTDQFIRVEKGNGTAIIENKVYELKDGSAIIIPAGSRHNVISGDNIMKLYTIYTPAEHAPGLLQDNKPNMNGGYKRYIKYKKKYMRLIKN